MTGKLREHQDAERSRSTARQPVADKYPADKVSRAFTVNLIDGRYSSLPQDDGRAFVNYKTILKDGRMYGSAFIEDDVPTALRKMADAWDEHMAGFDEIEAKAKETGA